MTYPQMKAIISKYVDNYPEAWHEGMAFHVLEAMGDACRNKLLK
jgi:hypothetical protein